MCFQLFLQQERSSVTSSKALGCFRIWMSISKIIFWVQKVSCLRLQVRETHKIFDKLYFNSNFVAYIGLLFYAEL